MEVLIRGGSTVLTVCLRHVSPAQQIIQIISRKRYSGESERTGRTVRCRMNVTPPNTQRLCDLMISVSHKECYLNSYIIYTLCNLDFFLSKDIHGSTTA